MSGLPSSYFVCILCNLSFEANSIDHRLHIVVQHCPGWLKAQADFRTNMIQISRIIG